MLRPGGMSSDEESDYEGFSVQGNGPTRRRRIFEVKQNSNDAFVSAAQRGDEVKMKEIFSEGVDINYKPQNNWNAILHVANQGNLNLLRWLIENGADVKSSHEKVTPILALCNSTLCDELKLYECLDLLLANGANPHDKDWFQVPAISKAVKRNHKKLVIRLLAEGCNVNQADVDGWTPLFYAIDCGNKEMIDFLKDSGASLYIVDKRGRSLLEFAASKENKDIIEMLGGGKYSQDDDNFLQVYRSSYEDLLVELPKSNLRFTGFPSEVNKLLSSIGLQYLSHDFNKNSIGLGHLLTLDNETLKEIGVNFSFDRIKILYAVKVFLEYPWHISSFGTNFTNSYMNIFQVAETLATISRQLTILNITMYRWKQTENEKDVDTIRTMVKSCRELLRILRAINKRAKFLDKTMNSVSCDLIVPEKVPPVKWKKIVLITALSGAFILPVITISKFVR